MSRRISFRALVLTGSLLVFSTAILTRTAHAQSHGVAANGGGGLSAYSRPDGVVEKDDLHDFHQVLAAQASSQQVAQFQALLKLTDSAKLQIESFKPADAAGRAALTQALDSSRTATRSFLESFSLEQTSVLRETLKRLSRADVDLDQEEKKLADLRPDVTAVLERSFAEFASAQLSLARQMSIIAASGQDLSFTLPRVKTPLRMADLSLAIPTSGVLSQTAVQGDQRTFHLDLVSDLTDVQQNITQLLRAQLEESDLCGQRVAIREATLTPAAPATLLTVKLHFERWMCTRLYGQTNSTEMAETNGSVEILLTPSVEANVLTVQATIRRVEASGMLADALRTGSLGDDFRQKSSQLLLAALHSATDFKTALPAAVQGAPTAQSVKFQEMGIGSLGAVVSGQLQISNQQADLLASQLNQALAAQSSASR